MPMHDWTRATAGTYHDFHLSWIAAMRNKLNAGLLPAGLFAMAEQIIGGPSPDVVTLHDWPDAPASAGGAGSRGRGGGVLVLPEPSSPPQTEIVVPAGPAYARKTSQVVIKHELGHVLSVIELVSPGNKHSLSETRRIVDKSAALIHEGVHLLLVDPFPPTPRDQHGLANLIWHEIDATQDLPFFPERPLLAASFQARPLPIAHVTPFAVGDALPAMPVFLVEDRYITLPLDETYAEVWSVLPPPIRRVLEPG